MDSSSGLRLLSGRWSGPEAPKRLVGCDGFAATCPVVHAGDVERHAPIGLTPSCLFGKNVGEVVTFRIP